MQKAYSKLNAKTISGSATLTAMAPSLPLANYRSVYEVALRTLVGSTVFVLLAILAAGLQNLAIAKDFQF